MIVWHLEMRSPEAVTGQPLNHPDAVLVEANIRQAAFNRFLYQLVGEDWGWTEKNRWSLERWQAQVERPEVRTWVLYVKGSPAGYVEMVRQPLVDGEGHQIEIENFGLARPFIGQGLGRGFLTEALNLAWAFADEQGNRPKRVWLHTCSDDHPNARANYEARGFRLFKTVEEE